MSSAKTMSTQQIKKGLQNIKMAQLEVLQQLKADSFALQNKTIQAFSHLEIKTLPSTQQLEKNNENVQLSRKADKAIASKKMSQKINNKKDWESSQLQSIQTNQSSNSTGSSKQSYQALRKQFTAQREELNTKFNDLNSKISVLQKESQDIKKKSKTQQNQMNQHSKILQEQKNKLILSLRQKNHQLQTSQNVSKKLSAQLQLASKQKTILQAEIISLRLENSKLGRKIKETQLQYNDQISKAREQIKFEARVHPQIKMNMDLVMKLVKSISSNHDFLFSKLKESTTLDMDSIQKQSEIQNPMSQLLEYFEIVQITNSQIIQQQAHQKKLNYNQKNLINQSEFNFNKSLFHDRPTEDFQHFKDHSQKIGARQIEDLQIQNEILKVRIKELSQKYSSLIESSNKKNNRNSKESNRFLSLQLEETHAQLVRLKRFKQQAKQNQMQKEKQIQKHNLKAKELQAKIHSNEKKILETITQKFNLQQQSQQLSREITSLNFLVQELNAKLNSSSNSSPALTQACSQFSKIMETNSQLLRENQSLRAINDGLQVQIQNLKYQKDQFQENNKQKQVLIERQIKERNHLLQQIEKKEIKAKQLKEQMQKINNVRIINEDQSLKTRKNLQDLLDQKNQEVLQLRKQIEQLYKQSREYRQIKFQFDKLQMEYKELVRKSTKMGETLSHLWSVKEAEYHNINQILGLFKISNLSSIQQQSHNNI